LQKLKNLSLKNAKLAHFLGFLTVFYAIMRFLNNRVSPATRKDVGFDTVLIGLFRSASFFYYNVFRGFSQANV